MKTGSPLQPVTIDALRHGADAAMAMLAGIQLNVFTALKDGPKNVVEIADHIGCSHKRLSLLLYAIVSAGLLEEKDGYFSNTREAQHFLVKGVDSYIGDMASSLAVRWGNELKTAESIRTGIPQSRLDFANTPLEELESLLRRINIHTVGAACELLEIEDFSSVASMVDVGGGAGGLAITLAKAVSHMKATVIELPRVTPITRKIIGEEGLSDRVSVSALDVVNNVLSGNYDIAMARSLLQVLSPSDAEKALENIAAAIKPGGTLYIIGQILDDSHLTPVDAVGRNLNFINLYEVGESYTEAQHRKWLESAGFIDIDRSDFMLSGGYGLIKARKRY